ncbi:MAG: hypothetical protein V9E90_05265 [Saprospiraceae bacterium]|jgi:hypothetical protein
MKIKFSAFIIILLLSTACKIGTKNETIDNTNDSLNSHYSQLLMSIDSEFKNDKMTLIVPKNSCKKCKEYIINNCENLSKNIHLNVIITGITDKKSNNCGKNFFQIPVGYLERKMPVFGITLVTDSSGHFIFKYLDPTNIQYEVDKLIP